MRVLYVASEVTPFAASGGLGDVMGALPKAVRALHPDWEVGVICPLYGSISESDRAQMINRGNFTVSLSWRRQYCGIFELQKDGVRYFFVDNEYYFKRGGGLYGQYDDGERFAFFCRAVMEFALQMDFVPDVLHANDWQAALTVIYAKRNYASYPAFRGMKTVFTIHNIEYQGKYDRAILGDVFDISDYDCSLVEFDGCINLMKGAIVATDKLTTVSPNYARELTTSYFAFGLQQIIRENSYKFSGIINGLDTAFFDPASPILPCPYDKSSLEEGKAKNKAALQRELGLPERPDVPLIVMITRLTAAKGVDLLLARFEELMREDLQFVLLGTGERCYEDAFRGLCEKHGDRARALLRFDRDLSKRMYAAADLFLMPSRSEPCGLAQMTACRYGTVPIVRGCGGLYDTILPYDREDSNGFVFWDYDAWQLLEQIRYALRTYRDKNAWNALRLRAVNSDFSWEQSARRYSELYCN